MLIDISPIIASSIAVWPGDTPFARNVSRDMNDGANLTLSDIRTTLHLGAHCDAPSHYLANGSDVSSLPLDLFVGPCNVLHVDVPRGERIKRRHIQGKTVDAPRVLFRTGTFPDATRWNDDFASLSPELVEDLAARGVKLVGIDTPSVDPFDDKLLEAHQALGRHAMANLEGLVLGHVDEGAYELIALPLRIRGGDASPLRAVLRTLP